MQHSKPENGLFIISLDFELLWGVRDKRTIESYGSNIRGVRQVIPSLLKLFDIYQVHATFATVGFLFCQSKEELLRLKPSVLPDYNQDNYSPYSNNYLDNIGANEQEDIYHYAPSLIKMIQQHPKQEIATHTFCHYYCLEGATLQSFEEDLLAAIAAAKTYNIELKSIIFPRNQYSKQHIEICQKHGITSYRGNEQSQIYKPRKNEEQNRFVRALRLIDAYVNLTGHNTHDIHFKKEHGLLNIPSSSFLRPYSKKLSFLDGLRLKRIKDSMTYAAKKGEAYHLWWHPHNFGANLQENIDFLEAILQHYQHLNQQYGFVSKTMKEIAETPTN